MSITNVGTHGFAQVGSVRWRPNGWDLDTLIVPMQGSAENLDAFIATLTMWDPSALDSNMFLSDWGSDGDMVWPTVDLIYIGKQGGTLPPVRAERSKTLQTISFAVEIESVASFAIDVQYMAPVNVSTTITRDDSDPSVSDPADTREIVYWTIGALSTVNSGGVTQEVIDDLIDYLFGDLVLSTPKSEELVPGEYYRNSISKTLLWTR